MLGDFHAATYVGMVMRDGGNSTLTVAHEAVVATLYNLCLVCSLCLPLTSLHLSDFLGNHRKYIRYYICGVTWSTIFNAHSGYVLCCNVTTDYMYHFWTSLLISLQNRMVVLTMDWLLEICSGRVLLKQHTHLLLT